MLLGLSPPLIWGPEFPVPIDRATPGPHAELSHQGLARESNCVRHSCALVGSAPHGDPHPPPSQLPYLRGKLLGDLSWVVLGPPLTP